MKIAIYGKGGIGKSSIVSNLSVYYSKIGKKVLQIGCDPKKDSTRAIVLNSRVVTAVDVLTREEGGIKDILMEGKFGIHCVEAGGPEPGVGCAGLGILKMLETLRKGKAFDGRYDIIIFDVLGDVVCGGFAVPMRRGYAEAVYVVTSSEFMSLYAANNICRGIKRYAKKGGAKLGGFIANYKSENPNTVVVEKIAKEIGTKVIHHIPFIREFYEIEFERASLLEKFSNSEFSKHFKMLGDKIWNNKEFVVPKPLDDEKLEELYLKYKLQVKG